MRKHLRMDDACKAEADKEQRDSKITFLTGDNEPELL